MSTPACEEKYRENCPFHETPKCCIYLKKPLRGVYNKWCFYDYEDPPNWGDSGHENEPWRKNRKKSPWE